MILSLWNTGYVTSSLKCLFKGLVNVYLKIQNKFIIICERCAPITCRSKVLANRCCKYPQHCDLSVTCDSVWPGIECGCVYLRLLAVMLLEITLHASQAQFHHFHLAKVNGTWVTSINLFLANEIQGMPRFPWNVLFCDLLIGTNIANCGWSANAILFSINLHPLAFTCWSVWPWVYILFLQFNL